jgi:hypothetical protein
VKGKSLGKKITNLEKVEVSPNPVTSSFNPIHDDTKKN